MSSRSRAAGSVLLLVVAAACTGEAEDGTTLQAAVESTAVANPEIASVSNENALGALHRALMQSMERAEILEDRASDERLRELAGSIREERAALMIAVSDEAARVGVELDPPGDSAATVTAGRELRQAHEAAMERLREVDAGAFDTVFASVASQASLEAAERLQAFDAAALAPGVLEQVKAVAAALTWEADELAGVVASQVPGREQGSPRGESDG